MLFNKIYQLPENKALLVSEDLVYTTKDIKECRENNLDLLSSLNEKVVALQFKDNIDLAKWLILLDGIASSILILPFDIQKATLELFLEQAQCGFVLCESTINEQVSKGRQLREVKTNWLISTSGTTSKPKLVSHNLMSLTNTIKVGSPNFVWASLYDLNRFSGIQVFLQALCSGNKLVIKNGTTSLTQTIMLFQREKVTCVSGTPTYFRKLLMVKGFSSLPLKSISLGGEIAEQKLLSSLKSTFVGAKIRHIYASSEAGVGFSVNDGLAGFPLSYLEFNEDLPHLKIGPEGTLLIKSESSASNYVNGANLIDENGFVDTGDLVEVKDGRCMFLGRASGIINVGGNKVVPEIIEEFLQSIQGVNAAKVYGKNNSFVGEVVCADIVLSTSLDTKTIRDYCKKGLAVHEQPVFIKIVDELDTTSSGKIKR